MFYYLGIRTVFNEWRIRWNKTWYWDNLNDNNLITVNVNIGEITARFWHNSIATQPTIEAVSASLTLFVRSSSFWPLMMAPMHMAWSSQLALAPGMSEPVVPTLPFSLLTGPCMSSSIINNRCLPIQCWVNDGALPLHCMGKWRSFTQLVNDRRLPIQCWVNDGALSLHCWLNYRRLVNIVWVNDGRLLVE